MAVSAILPHWLTELLPELNQPHLLTVSENGKFVVVAPDDDRTVHSGLAEVRDATHGFDLEIDPAVYGFLKDQDPSAVVMGMLTFPVSEKFMGTIIPYSDKKRLEDLERSFEASLRWSIRYASNPEDFLVAYHFVDSHPAFWTAQNLSETPWWWMAQGHCQQVSQSVYRDEGELVISLETGGHVEPDFKSHYHDYRLDVSGETFEEAFIRLAARVSEVFNPDGTEREGVEFEKPEWLLIVEERLKDLEDDLDGEGSGEE